MTKIIHLFLISMVIVTGLNVNNSVAQEKKMNILKNKPVYRLSLKAFGTKFFVQVNGMVIHEERFSGGQLSTSLPINHWMRSGPNTIGIYVLPPKPGEAINPNASVSITLMVRGKDKPDTEYSIADIAFSEIGRAHV